MDSTISPKELSEQMAGSAGPRVIDLRDQDIYGAGHIPGALNIPILLLQQNPDFVPDDRPVVVYDGANQEGQPDSEDAARLLSERGIQASTLQGGFAAWTSAGYPVEREPSEH